MRWTGLGFLFVLGCSSAALQPRAAEPVRPAVAGAVALSTEQLLDAAANALDTTNYSDAERLYRAAASDGARRTVANLGVARVQLATGRYSDAMAIAIDAHAMKDMRVAQEVTKALALRALGKVSDALQVLGEGQEQGRDAAAEVLRAELLLELGKRDEAEPVLLAVMEAYNRGEIAEDDSDGLGLVARAAQLMRSPEDANAAFNEAEQAGNVSVQTLLWRAEWHLQNHDIAHTVEVLDEILKRAPTRSAGSAPELSLQRGSR
jgi:cellulose synthase operon protein C